MQVCEVERPARVERLRRAQLRSLREAAAAHCLVELQHEVRVGAKLPLTHHLDEGSGHRAARRAVARSSVCGVVVVLAAGEEDHVTQCVKRVVVRLPSVSAQREGQVEARPGVAAVHHRGQPAAGRERLDEHDVQLVVRDLPDAIDVAGDDRLVHAILLRKVGVCLLSTMATEVEKEHVARVCVLREPLACARDVGLGRVEVAVALVVS
mmetsp:Transcript_768/g.2122  ORF Transcript_768/g.2122 Transcript_768/m.2122 type:complete len:209 (-) Transcript_768:751-1377(-)